MDEQKPSSPDMSIEDAVATLVSELPQPIREFITGPKRNAVSLALMQKHGLHADQAAAFEHAYLFMLLGIESPEEFSQELREAGIEEGTVTALATDVNEMVFKPLRSQMQAATPAPAQPAPTYRAPLVPPMKLVEAAPTPVTPLPAPAPVPVVPPPVSAVIPPPMPVAPSGEPSYTVRTMAHDIEAVKEHRAPEAIPVVHHSEPVPPVLHTPEQIPVPPSPRTAPPPPNLPGAPIQKQYGVDPYREPME